MARIKRTDASKLQDEYAKLVEGLQEATNDEDAFMSNPGLWLLRISDLAGSHLRRSVARRSSQRSHTWKYPKSGALRRFP